MTPWMAVTVVSRSSTSAPIDTFMTLASTVIRNWARASSISTPVPPLRPPVAWMPRLLVVAWSHARRGPGGARPAPGVHPGEGTPLAACPGALRAPMEATGTAVKGAALDWSLWEVIWTSFVFFCWIAVLVIFFQVIIDIFRSHDLTGWGKAGWLVLLIVLPFIGLL